MVKDTRPAEDNSVIRRRRLCETCGGKFTTYERPQLRILSVVKSDGRRQEFDRDKLEHSLTVAMHKRSTDQERISQMVTGIIRRLEERGEHEVPSTLIGTYVMKSLALIDTVAYVRFASVYKNFQQVDDFESFVAELRPNYEDESTDGNEP